MTRLTLDISMSLDGFIAGPNQTVESPLGEGGEQLHEWIFGLASWPSTTACQGARAGPTTTWSGNRSKQREPC